MFFKRHKEIRFYSFQHQSPLNQIVSLKCFTKFTYITVDEAVDKGWAFD